MPLLASSPRGCFRDWSIPQAQHHGVSKLYPDAPTGQAMLLNHGERTLLPNWPEGRDMPWTLQWRAAEGDGIVSKRRSSGGYYHALCSLGVVNGRSSG